MKWYIGSFSELEHLSDSERKHLLRQHGALRLTLRMAAGSLVSGILFAVVVTVTLMAPPLRMRLAYVAFPVLCVIAAALAYQFSLIRIRGQLLIYLEQAARKQRLPLCLHCGYRLEGLEGDTCPECGKAITCDRSAGGPGT